MNVRVCLLAGVLLGMAFSVCGQTAYFNVTDGIWEAPGNWSPTFVPGITNSVSVTFEGRTVRITQPGAICTNLVAGYDFGQTGTVCLATGTLYAATSQNVGRNGRGTFIQSAGTTNRFGTFLTVGEGTTGNGRYELQGGYLGASGSAAFEMNVGYNGLGVFYQSGGTLGDLYIAKYLYIGRTATGNGTYLMNGGEVLFTNQTYVSVGHNGNGSFVQSNGTVTVGVPAVFNVGKEVGGNGTYRLVNGKMNAYQFTMGEKATASGTAYLEGGELAAGISIDVGYNGTGTVWQSGGAVTVSNQYIYIGRIAGSKGSYVMTGGDIALTNTANYLFVGEYGNGSFLQSNGTIRVKNYLAVSRKTGSTGFYRIAGGSLTVDTQLEVCEQVGTSARFEVVGTNSVINAKAFSMTTNAVLRFEIATNGVSKIAVQNNAALAGKLEVAVQQRLFNQPVTIMSVGSKSGTFDSVIPVFPLRAVSISYPSGAGNVVLSNFRYYTGTLIAVH